MADLQIPSEVGSPSWKDSSFLRVLSEAKGNLQQELLSEAKGNLQQELPPAQNTVLENTVDFSGKNRTNLVLLSHGNQVGTSLSPC